jgi:geranylgeranyl diphosphate/geranylgeranyl-bacteriochlorophyllide a reductase
MLPRRIAIVGGGPAGAYAAAELGRCGQNVLLFDEKLAWEKPCGGGITDKALARWPFLCDAGVEPNWISCCELIAPSGQRATLPLDRQIAVFSRYTLNGLLLDRARESGATVIQDRIISMTRDRDSWSLQSRSESYGADFVLLAAGARTAFRNLFSEELGPENFMVALGYYIPGTSQTVQIKFLDGLHGYIWIFPRADHFSAGICGHMHGKSTVELRRILEESLPEFGLTHNGARFYAHLIPSLSPGALRTSEFCGKGWALIGDAAGFVDAITGEGLYYALRSAELFCDAYSAGDPEQYAALLAREVLPELERAARIADRFYAGEWLGGSVVERMVQLTGSSHRFRNLMRDLFSGTQEYSTLKQRVYRSMPAIAAQALVNTLWRGEGEDDAGHEEISLSGVGNRI